MVKITVGRTSWDIDSKTAKLLVKYKDDLDKAMHIWNRNREFKNKEGYKINGRPAFICLIRDAIYEMEHNLNGMPKSCEDIRAEARKRYKIKETDSGMRRLRYINLRNDGMRWCIEEYISKRLDQLSESKQIGKPNIDIKRTRNKYRLTTGSLRRAKLLYLNPDIEFEMKVNGEIKKYKVDCKRWKT